MPTPKIGSQFTKPKDRQSPDERERAAQEAAEARAAAEVDEPMTAYQKQKLEQERTAMLEALRDTRPPRPAADAPAPESLSTRVKATPESAAAALSPPAPEPEVIVPEAQLTEATERQRVAQEALARAQAESDEADAALVQVKADHAAAVAEQKLQQHRAVLVPALAAAHRQRVAFQKLFDEFGGAGRDGTTRGILALYAKTIPGGDVKRQDLLGELYKQAGILMETVRLGYQAAFRAVEATKTALERLCISDASDFRFEQAGLACEEASAHDPVAVRAACVQLVADVKAVDGEPGGPEVVVYLDVHPRAVTSPGREAMKEQTHAEGVGEIDL